MKTSDSEPDFEVEVDHGFDAPLMGLLRRLLRNQTVGQGLMMEITSLKGGGGVNFGTVCMKPKKGVRILEEGYEFWGRGLICNSSSKPTIGIPHQVDQ